MFIKAQNCEIGLLAELMFFKCSIKLFMFNLGHCGKVKLKWLSGTGRIPT